MRIKWNGMMNFNSLINYSGSDIQDYFVYIIKKLGNTDILTSETRKLLSSTENKTTKDENGENVLHLEITEVVLVNCNIVNNNYR